MKQAFVTLLSVIILGLVSVAVSAALLTLGALSSKTSLARVQSNQARGLADACTDKALEIIKESNSFEGNGNLSLGQGSCSYTVIKGASENREIRSTGTVGTIARKVKTTIDIILPQIHLASWVEVADF